MFAAVTLRLLQRRPEKRGKVQLKALVVPADMELVQRMQEQQQKQQKQEQEYRAGVERYVLESVRGAAVHRKPPNKTSKAAAIRAANAKIPGMAEPSGRRADTPAGAGSSASHAQDTAADNKADEAPPTSAKSAGSARKKKLHRT